MSKDGAVFSACQKSEMSGCPSDARGGTYAADLAVVAQRLGTVCASPPTWYRLVRKYGWRRPRLRVHPAKPKVGLRTTGADKMWHIDTTVIRITSVRISACTPGRRVRRVHFRLI